MAAGDNKEGLEKLKILVVEDQADARALLRGMLGELGITQIFEAADGREALSFTDIAVDMIDVVICDWNMPRMTGIELLRQMRAADLNMPFLMLTGRGDIASVNEAKMVGVSGYIRKPFSPASLEIKLRVIKAKMETD